MPEVERYSAASLIKYTWDQLAEVFWERYPNPFSAHVVTEDVILRHVENGVLHTRRVLCKRKTLPALIRTMTGRSQMSSYVVEDSVVDRNERIIWTYTYNVQLRRFNVFAESVLYYEMPASHNNIANPSNRVIVCDKHAMSASKLGGYLVANTLMSRYRKTEQESTRGLQYVLDRHYLPPEVNAERKLNIVGKWHSDSITFDYRHIEQSVAGSGRLFQRARNYFARYSLAMYSRLRMLKDSIQLNAVSP